MFHYTAINLFLSQVEIVICQTNRWKHVTKPTTFSGHIYKQKTTFKVYGIINVFGHVCRPNTLVIK